MTNSPVPVGQMLFTLVDPHRGHEATYNRWYERDHFYGGCMIGPGWFAGSRWVAPRRLKDLRFPATGPFAEPTEAGSYLAVYWIHEHEKDAAEKWAREQVTWLYAEGRGYAEREHIHTGLYRPDSSVLRREDGVPLDLALDHRYGGLVAVAVEPAPGTDRDAFVRLLDDGPVRRLLDSGAVDQVSTWRDKPWPTDLDVPMQLGSTGGTPERLLQLCFLEEDPAGRWDEIRAYAADVDRTGAGRVTFVAPFIPTVVGTDTYTDQLW